jgi:hypothetical protein
MGSFGFSKSEEKVFLVEEVIEAGKEPASAAENFFLRAGVEQTFTH